MGYKKKILQDENEMFGWKHLWLYYTFVIIKWFICCGMSCTNVLLLVQFDYHSLCISKYLVVLCRVWIKNCSWWSQSVLTTMSFIAPLIYQWQECFMSVSSLQVNLSSRSDITSKWWNMWVWRMSTRPAILKHA